MQPFASVDLTGIRTWSELDERWAAALGFPEWYGRNRDARLDIMSSLDEIGMVRHPFEGRGAMVIKVHVAEDLVRGNPGVFAELVALTAAANRRYERSGSERGIALVFASG
jgi:hypothetical protein